jgi:hypothetical protein
MEIDEKRHDHKAIRALYEGEGYPLVKKAS